MIENNAQHAKKLFETLDQIHIVCIHPNGLSINGKDFYTNVDEAIKYCSAKSNAGYNIYFTVNRVRDGLDKKPSKDDIINARFLHIDIDQPKNGAPFDKQEVSDFLMDTECPPSFIVDSGNGIQAFWRLDIPQQNIESIEYINKQIKEYYQADHCWNIDRLMRVPGFRNIPDKAKRKLGRVEVATGWMVHDTGETYEAQEVTNLFPEASNEVGTTSSRIDVELDAIELKTPEDLGLAAGDMAYQAIMHPEGKDRSADGLGACRLLALAGKTDAEIAGILVNKDLPISDHFLSQKYVMRALRRTIGLVRVDTPEISQINIDFDAFIGKVEQIMRPDDIPEMPSHDEEVQDKPKYTVPLGVPAWQRDMGDGGLAQFVRHCEQTATSPQPFVSLGAALACYGTLAGRRYKGPTGLRTNIYAIGICDSGGGKDHPLRQATNLMIEAEQPQQIGPARLASGQALITAMKRSPSIMLPIDEFGFLMRAAAGRNAKQYIVEIMDNLTALYSQAPHTFMGVGYANDQEKPTEVIEQPCVSLIGVTTPAVFWDNMSNGNVQDGSLARLIVFESENSYPDARHNIGQVELPAMLVNNAKQVAEGVNDPFPLGISPIQAPRPHLVTYADPRAEAFAREMRDQQTAMLRQHAGTNITSIIARLAENASKIALIHAISENPKNPMLRQSNLEWGLMIARQSVDSMTEAVKERVADNEQEEYAKRVYRIINDAGKSGITKNVITRKTQFLDARRRSSILSDLEDSEQIKGVQNVGSKTVIFYAQ